MKNKRSYLTMVILVMYFSFILQISSVLSTNNSFGVNWYRKWGGNDPENGNGVAVDSSDNIYFVGYSYSFGQGSSAIAVLKYDNSGTLLWNRTWGGSSYDKSYGVTVDSLDNVYLTGETGSFGAGGVDMVLVKYDSSGIQLWNRTWGGSAILNVDTGWGVEVDSLDNIYLVGVSNNFGAGEEDIILVKYDSSGVQLWNRTWGGALSDSGFGIALDSSNNIFIVGETFSFGAGEEDIILVKYDSSGVQLWNRTWGGALSDSSYGIAIDSTDNIYLTGETGSFGAGGDDMVLVKYDNSGIQLWNRTWGGDNREICYCGAVDSSDNLYLGGFSDTYVTYSDMLLVNFGYKEGPTGGDAFPLELIIITSSVIGGGAVIGLAIFILRRRRPK